MPTKPTDSIYEANKGRIALWLSPEQITLILDQARIMRDDQDEKVVHQWAEIQFRAAAALHKHGKPYEPPKPGY